MDSSFSCRRLVGICLAAATAWACTPPSTPPRPSGTLVMRFIEDDPGQLLNLDSLLAGEEPIEEWGFEGAERAAWSVIGEEGIEPGENGIPLPAGHKRLLVERVVNLDTSEVDLIRIVVRSDDRRLPQLRRWHVTMEWATRGPPAAGAPTASNTDDSASEYAVGQKAWATRRASSPREFVFRFSLAGNPAWRGQIGRLRFTLRWPHWIYRGGGARIQCGHIRPPLSSTASGSKSSRPLKARNQESVLRQREALERYLASLSSCR